MENAALRLNSVDVVKQLNTLSDMIVEDTQHSIVFSLDLPLGNAVTNEISKKSIVGISGLSLDIRMHNDKLSKKLLSNNKISDSKFVECLISVFHEANHVKQFYDDMQRDTEYAKILAYNDLTSYDTSLRYYSRPDNYYNNPRELLAEYNGIISSYEYLSINYDDLIANELILKYVNMRVNDGEHRNYFIKKNVSNFEDIEIVFNKEYDMSVEHKRIYQKSDKNTDSDKVMRYLKQHDLIFDKFCNASSAIEQDKMIAAVVLYFKPELQTYYHSLDDEDMSIETVFNIKERQLPSEFEEILRQDTISDDIVPTI